MRTRNTTAKSTGTSTECTATANYPPVMLAPVQAIDTATVQELTKAIKNMTTSAQLQQQEIQKQHNENLMLRNNIQKIKSDKAYFRCFTDTVDGVAMCTEGDGFRSRTTAIGIISIISAQSYKVPYKDDFRKLVLVRYTDSRREPRETIVTADEISAKNLIRKFHGFEYQCKSKSLANDYLADKINKVKSSYVITLHEYVGFYLTRKKHFSTATGMTRVPKLWDFIRLALHQER